MQHAQTCQRQQDIPRVLQIPGNILGCIRGIIHNMESFACRLYALSSSVCDVNDLLYWLFCTKRGGVQPTSSVQGLRTAAYTACQLPGSNLEDRQTYQSQNDMEGQLMTKGMLTINTINKCSPLCSNNNIV